MVISEESVKYSLNNLKMRKSRSFLTILSIFFGISAIFIFVSFGWGLYDYVNEFATDTSANKVLVQPKGGGVPGLDDTFALTESDLRVIKRVAGVSKVTGISFEVSEIQKGSELRYTFIAGYDPRNDLFEELSTTDLMIGRDLQRGETGKVMLGSNYLLDDKIFSKGLKLNDNFEVNGQKVKIIGFMEPIGNPGDDANIYVTTEFFEELYPSREGTFGWVAAEVEDINDIDRVVEDVEKAVRKNRNQEEGQEDFFVQSFTEMIETYSGALDIVIGFVVLIALISVSVSAVNTANTMITSVIERTKEIGIIKSIGAPNSEILKIFLFESAFLGFISGLIGIAVGFGATELANSVLESLGWSFLSPHYSWTLFIGCVAFATLTGALSGIIPAYRASKTNPVDALRYE